LDNKKFIVFINYATIADTFKDRGSLLKKNRYLINWRLFLTKYTNFIKIYYCAGLIHININVLLKLPKRNILPAEICFIFIFKNKKINIFIIFYSDTDIICFLTKTVPRKAYRLISIIILYFNEFLSQQILKLLFINKFFDKFYKIIIKRLKKFLPNLFIIIFEKFRLDQYIKLLFF